MSLRHLANDLRWCVGGDQWTAAEQGADDEGAGAAAANLSTIVLMSAPSTYGFIIVSAAR